MTKDFKTGTTLVAEIVNGCGIGEAAEGLLFDKDKYKNFMVRIKSGHWEEFQYWSYGIYRERGSL